MRLRRSRLCDTRITEKQNFTAHVPTPPYAQLHSLAVQAHCGVDDRKAMGPTLFQRAAGFWLDECSRHLRRWDESVGRGLKDARKALISVGRRNR